MTNGDHAKFRLGSLFARAAPAPRVPVPGSALDVLFGTLPASPAAKPAPMSSRPAEAAAASPSPPHEPQPRSSPTDAPPPAAVDPRAWLIDPTDFLTPRDLQRNAGDPVRVLGIGSCFLQALVAARDTATDATIYDFVLFNGLRDFPDAPPAAIGDYAYQIVQMPLRDIMHDTMFTRLSYADEDGYRLALQECIERLRMALDVRMTWNVQHGLLTMVMNFMAPQFNPMGRLLPRFDLRNPEYFVTALNEELERLSRTYRNCYILDADRVAASFGRRFVQDDSLTNFGHNAKLSGPYRVNDRIERLGAVAEYFDMVPGPAFTNALLAESHAIHATLRQSETVKLVVVDLDDTLWNGVSGDTADIGPHMLEGWPIGFVEALDYLRKRGVALAIISKNDETRIRDIWPRIFVGTRLQLADFAAIRINWQPKPENMADILRTVNLLPQNVVFIDDNPAERGAMQAAYPAMRILGENPFHLRRILLLAPQTQVASITDESARRTEMLQAQALREEDRSALSPMDFARQQDVRVQISPLCADTHPRFPRALELINKTNQFNTNGRRWTAADCTAFFAQGGVFVAFEVEDRYTAYGLVGVVIVHDDRIAQWVMSCRVIGMAVEQAVMHTVVAQLRQSGAGAITAELVETAVNQPCHGLFAKAGFTQRDGYWRLDPDATPAAPLFVTIRSPGS